MKIAFIENNNIISERQNVFAGLNILHKYIYQVFIVQYWISTNLQLGKQNVLFWQVPKYC